MSNRRRLVSETRRTNTLPPNPGYVMRDQARGKIERIMDTAPDPTSSAPLLSRPGWVAITLLVVAFNLMAVLPRAA